MKVKTMKKVIKNIVILSIFIFFSGGLFIYTTFAQNNDSKNTPKDVKVFVEYKILKDNDLKDADINVRVNDPSVILSGSVPTIYERNLASNDASTESKGYSIQNNLVIAESKIPSDKVIKNVLYKIYNNAFYSVFDWINAVDSNGTVTLTGWVHYPWYKEWFQKEAEKVPGVRKINNQIQDTFGPGSIGYRAARLIYSQPEYEGMQFMSNPPVHIIVINDSIILEGQVNTDAESGVIKNLLEFYTGAFHVTNNLQIRS